MIRFSARLNEWEVLELSIQVDHVHAVLAIKPMDSASDVMKIIKGGTSKKLRILYPELVESIWSKGFWAEGYYAGTVGTKDLVQVRKYVREQRH